VVIVALAIAWFYGGNYPGKEQLSVVSDQLSDAEPQEQWTVDSGQKTRRGDYQSPAGAVPSEWSEEGEGDAAEIQETSALSAPTETSESPETPSLVLPTAAETTAPTMEIEPGADKDKYLTDPAPQGKPLPVEPQDVSAGDGSFSVTLSVRCDMILRNMNLLNKEKHELIPEDGVILPSATVTAYEGESVFNVLHRTMKQAGIHLTFRNTPIYNSAYIEDINNLYEFDVGELSGWMYCVNGWYPNYGCSRYQLKPDDVIEWNYTCDLGRDLDQNWIGGRQEDE
jgi:hypothetical protein